MKKKILVVFLVCCMLLGVPSVAMAADIPAFESDFDYFILEGNFPHPNNSSWEYPDHTYLAVEFSDYSKESSSGLIPFLHIDDNGDISSICILNDRGQAVRVSVTAYTYYNSSWHGDFYSYSNSTSSGDFFVSLKFASPFAVSSILDTYSTVPLYSGHYNSSDDILENFVVFPQAPPDPMVTLAEQMMEKTPEALDLDGKMMILVPFGISCLALLISLPLLLKVLRRFLG